MRLAVIDIGTNSIRLDIYQVYPNGHFVRLHRSKNSVRLGEDVFIKGKLCTQGVKRAFRTLREFKMLCDNLCVEQIRTTATAALRQASNAEKFIAKIKKRLGIEIEIITGLKEAELILAGIRLDPRTNDGVIGFIDIGGGSTEIGVFEGEKIHFLESFPVGAIKLEQLYFKNGNIIGARNYILETFKAPKLPNIDLMLGSSGTIKSIHRILQKTASVQEVELKLFNGLIEKLTALPLEQRKIYPGMTPGRADIIVPGTLILQEAMVFFRTPTLSFTPYALRDGLLVSEISEIKRGQAREKLKRLK